VFNDFTLVVFERKTVFSNKRSSLFLHLSVWRKSFVITVCFYYFCKRC